MYYICACIPKAAPTPKLRATNFTNGHAKPEPRVQSKKKPAPSPPAALQPLELQQEDALAHLDRVLDTEADRLSSCSGQMSNVSAVASRSESVVADVHCPDVVSFVADSEPIPRPLSLDIPSLDSGIGDSTPNLIEHVLTDTAPEPENGNIGLDNDGNNTPVGNEEEKREDNSPLDNEKEKYENNSALDNEGEKHETNLPLVNVEGEPEDKNPSVDNVGEEGGELREPLNVVPPSPFQPDVIVDSFIDDKDENSPVASAVPSADYLKTVNLRHVQTQLKELEPEGNLNASDNNLKVGSAEYQNFIRDLNSRLQRSPVSAAVYVPSSKTPPTPTLIGPNENVLEEPIDRREATEKLRSFYAAKNDTPDRTEKKDKSASTKEQSAPL